MQQVGFQQAHSLMYLLCKSRVFTGDLAACNLKL